MCAPTCVRSCVHAWTRDEKDRIWEKETMGIVTDVDRATRYLREKCETRYLVLPLEIEFSPSNLIAFFIFIINAFHWHWRNFFFFSLADCTRQSVFTRDLIISLWKSIYGLHIQHRTKAWKKQIRRRILLYYSCTYNRYNVTQTKKKQKHS